MDRRIALKNLAFILGGAALLPACVRDHEGKSAIVLTKLDINADQQDFLASVVDTIIPKTDTPGARDLDLHLFVLKMVDDCFGKEDRDAFIRGLDKLSAEAKTLFGQPFGECPAARREALLLEIEHRQVEQQKDKKTPDDSIVFYRITKGETTFGYTNSQYFMTKQIVWELVPGRYNAYFPVKKLKAGTKYA